MYYKGALAWAKKMANRRGERIYVIYDPSDAVTPNEGYYVADTLDLDTYYAGAQVIDEVEPQ